jgi:hypothetical protein
MRDAAPGAGTRSWMKPKQSDSGSRLDERSGVRPALQRKTLRDQSSQPVAFPNSDRNEIRSFTMSRGGGHRFEAKTARCWEKHARPERQSGCAKSVSSTDFPPEILEMTTYPLPEIASKTKQDMGPNSKEAWALSRVQGPVPAKAEARERLRRPRQVAFPAAKGTILRAASSHRTRRRQLRLWSSVRRPTSLSSG